MNQHVTGSHAGFDAMRPDVRLNAIYETEELNSVCFAACDGAGFLIRHLGCWALGAIRRDLCKGYKSNCAISTDLDWQVRINRLNSVSSPLQLLR